MAVVLEVFFLGNGASGVYMELEEYLHTTFRTHLVYMRVPGKETYKEVLNHGS